MRRIAGWMLAGCLAMGAASARVPEIPRFRIVGSAQGLPASDNKALALDHEGYLWIATADGLARFDGIGMRVWRYDPDDPHGLPGNNIQALHVDARDRVWFAIEGDGIGMLDAPNRELHLYRKADHPQIGSDDTWTLASRGDDLWFGTYAAGVHRLARELIDDLDDEERWAEAMAAMAPLLDPGPARRALAEVLQTGRWPVCVDQLAAVSPEAVTAIADEVDLVTRR